MKKVYLTGVKPTGEVHIGNYFGAIKPAIEKSNNCDDYDYYYFIADYHALTTVQNNTVLTHNTLSVASIWLACGLNPEKVVLYKQSSIPQTFELATILANITPKGLLNRAHAYKKIVDINRENNLDADNNVNMGLYCYPVLMASDILLFNTNYVPVGLDQKQHIEIARDIAKYFNKKYGYTFVMPNGDIDENLATIPGLDGRKMSKSYNNTISLFATEDEIKKKIFSITTDSSAPNEPKDTNCTLFEYFKLFFDKTEIVEIENKFKSGISWADAKNILFEKVNEMLSPIREKYNYYMNNPEIVREILQKGAKKAHIVAEETITRVRNAIGVF